MNKLKTKTDQEISKKCVSIGIFGNEFSEGLIKTISTITKQAECLELSVFCPARIDENMVRVFANKVKDKRVKFILDKENNIIRLANQTASNFKGQYYLFLHENDTLTSYSLAVSLKQLKKPSPYALVHGYAGTTDQRNGNRQIFESLKNNENLSAFANGASMAMATILIKRSAWVILGGFSNTLYNNFELDFSIRAYKAFNKRIYLITRLQAEIKAKKDRSATDKLEIQHIFSKYQTLKQHNLNSIKYLEKALRDCVKKITCIDEFKDFRRRVFEYSDTLDRRLVGNIQEAVLHPILFSNKDFAAIELGETHGSSAYYEDGLAAGLISCISPQMYAGSFTQALGPHGIYSTLRSSFCSIIKEIKNIENTTMNIKDQKLSKGYKNRKFGVNLIGHAFDVIGLGEALRLIAKALIVADIPLSIIDVPAGNGCMRENNFLEKYVQERRTDDAGYAFNVICMSPSTHAKWLLEEGLELTVGRYSISAWFWETSTWPTPWENLFPFVDSAWTFSSIIHEALLPHQKNKVIKLDRIQFPAEIDKEKIVQNIQSKDKIRSKYDLPSDKIIFIFGFDPKSQIERKNPIACIRVFHDAFGDPFTTDCKRDVCLIVKTFKPENESREWELLISLVTADDRIKIILESLERDDLLSLYSCCDIFLSLHRTEGYGLGIAEAIQLGLKVIVTGYGGNVDFCGNPYADLVDYKLVPIPKGSYPFSIGHYWAEPDLNNAAKICQDVYLEIKGTNSQPNIQRINDQFSLIISGEAFRQNLENKYIS